jgi:hypothetical protein
MEMQKKKLVIAMRAEIKNSITHTILSCSSRRLKVLSIKKGAINAPF